MYTKFVRRGSTIILASHVWYVCTNSPKLVCKTRRWQYDPLERICGEWSFCYRKKNEHCLYFRLLEQTSFSRLVDHTILLSGASFADHRRSTSSRHPLSNPKSFTIISSRSSGWARRCSFCSEVNAYGTPTPLFVAFAVQLGPAVFLAMCPDSRHSKASFQWNLLS